MLTRSFKTLIVAFVAMLVGLGFVPAATPAQAAPYTGYNYMGTFTVYRMFKVDVQFYADTIKDFLFAVPVSDGFFFNKEGYAFVDGGYNSRPHSQALQAEFVSSIRVHIENLGYTASSLDEVMKFTKMVGKPKPSGEPYVIGPALGSESNYTIQRVATGTKDVANGYPAIIRIKGDLSQVKPYQVAVSANFDIGSRLRPLSSRFRGAEKKMANDPIERRVDKYGNEKYPYYQVLLAEYLVPGTQVISTKNPRTIVGMIGAGDYEWDGADALYPMNAWVALAQSKGIPVNVAGQSPTPSASATTAAPSVSASPSVTPTSVSPSATPSATPQPTEPSAPSEPAEQGWPIGWIVGVIVAALIAGVLVMWLMRKRKQPSESPRDGEAPKE